MVIVLKCIIGILICILLVFIGILFIPFHIKVHGIKRNKAIQVKSSAYWLPWIMRIRFLYCQNTFSVSLILFGIPLKIPLKKNPPKKESVTKKSKEGQRGGEKEFFQDKELLKTKTIPDEKKQPSKGKQIIEKIIFYKPFIKDTVLPEIKKIRHYFHIHINHIHLMYGHPDPAITGYCQGMVEAMKPFLDEIPIFSLVETSFFYDKKRLDFIIKAYFTMNLYGIVLRLFIIWRRYRKEYQHYDDKG
ncbi:MAG: hypothetical protein PHS99_01640 [Candidatus Marinimicrobia bacterium]|nr:hypothetical protein [Candidatus Neomarinimicrobiota bacterium]